VIELRRADIGFGRVVLDERGVERRGLFRTNALAWNELREYRLAIELRGAGPDLAYRTPLGLVLEARDLLRGLAGSSTQRARIELYDVAGRRRIVFGWRFRDAALGIGEILARIAEPALASAHAELGRVGAASFGTLVIAEREVTLGRRAPLPRERVESIELFDDSPVVVRVMAYGKRWPYSTTALRDVTNVATALVIARELGYTVRGARLLDEFRRP
jgi:hypothetical protein